VLVFLVSGLLSCRPDRKVEHAKTFVIRNKGGMTAEFCENGARLMSLKVPDKNGELVDVVIGFADPLDYDSASEPYFGATIGRYGNRIALGRFELDGKAYQVPVNNGNNALHGGTRGFQYSRWKLEKLGARQDRAGGGTGLCGGKLRDHGPVCFGFRTGA